MPHVINTINHHQEKTFKSFHQLLISYFTAPKIVLPQNSSHMYKFNIKDKVSIELSPTQRKQFGFKYTLNRGKYKKDNF